MVSSTSESTRFFSLTRFLFPLPIPPFHSLSAAKSIDLRRHFGITHIVSACPDYPLQGPNHLTIPVQDSEYEDILIHLPEACRFIRGAINGGGRVLVHCVMGISRSATVVAAYCENFWVQCSITNLNSLRTSDVDSSHLRPQGHCLYQKRYLLRISSSFMLSLTDYCSPPADTTELWLHQGTSRF